MCDNDKVLGLICFVAANYLFLTSWYATWFWILGPLIKHGDYTHLHWTVAIIETFFLIYCLIVYWRCAFGDPGFLPKNLKPPTSDKFKDLFDHTCEKCNGAWKPPRAYHCKTCNRCVFKMDHHCVWVNNCVGAMNGKFFLQFVISACIYCSIFAIILLFALLNCIGYYGQHRLIHLQTMSPMQAVGAIVMFFYSLFAAMFVYFTYDFYDDFMYGVDRNQTTVENYKEIFGVKWDLEELRCLYLGWRKWEWVMPWNPRCTHNYLERTYKKQAVINQSYKKETELITDSEEFEWYYLVK